PFNKNDNRFVEQKNSSLVRAYLGKDRFDTAEQCEMMNFLYDQMWVYYNLFQPVMRLEEKQILPQDSGVYKLKHKYDTAQTPFHRLSGTNAITQENQQNLTTLRDRTNPRQLRKEMYRLLDDLLATGADYRLGIKEVRAG
ncbi:MAG: hypothetical protein Q8R28_16480, partial [Dehalococcoidia bacterium]|nr:hypothetical protein [Dehalococcoidia bacterium]